MLFTEQVLRIEGDDPAVPALAVVLPVNALTWGEIDHLPHPGEATLDDIWEAITPHVVAWNLTSQDGTPVDPPAAAGVEVCELLTVSESAWLLGLVRSAHVLTPIGEEPRKENLQKVRVYARNMERQRNGTKNVKLGSFPMAWVPYLRMDTRVGTPAEWWATNAFDHTLATDVQAAWRDGIADVTAAEQQKARDAERVRNLKDHTR